LAWEGVSMNEVISTANEFTIVIPEYHVGFSRQCHCGRAGDAAGIDQKKAVKQGKAVVYRLDGKRIEGTQLPNGVYIINGKKVIVNKR